MLRNLLIFAFIITLLQFRGEINAFFNPPPDFAAEHDGKVILYATAWCPYCDKTRALLRENNIDYFEYDIEKSQKGKQQHRELGGSGIPVLLINGEVVKGYAPARILELASSS